MAFPLDDILLGPASFGRLHRLDGLIFHTGEEPKFGREYAVATAIWQRDNPGSYNFRAYDGGVMLNVPFLEASGGINPGSLAWAPGRFPFLERELAKAGPCPVRGCGGPYRNPTMHHGQVSFVGRTAQLDAALAPAGYVTDARRLIAWYDALPIRGPAPLVLSKHGHWQSNRTDCGEWMHSRLAAITPQPQEDDVKLSAAKHQVPKVVRIKAGATLYTDPGATEEHASGLPAFDAELFAWLDGPAPWLCRREGSDGLFMAPDSALDRSIPFRNYRLSAPLGGDAEAQARQALALVGKVRTAGVAALRRQAEGSRDMAAGAEAAAKNLQALNG